MRRALAVLAVAAARIVAEAAGAGGLEPVAGPLLGIWQEVGGAGETLEITADHCAVAVAGELDRLDPLLGIEGDVLVRSLRGERRERLRFTVAGDLLTLAEPMPQKAPAPEGAEAPVPRRYRRAAERPPVFDLSPLPLGEGRPSPERLAAVRGELAARMAREREAREALKTPRPSAAQRESLASLDREQAAWLRQLVAEVGWIDAARFGDEAALAAFRIVQHGGDLRFLATVLPAIRRDAEALGIAPEYAVLHDRTWLRLGRRQIYGSQVAFEPDGSVVVLPLEDPSGAEQRRQALGLPSFGQYLDVLRGYGDEGRAVSIREGF